VIHAIFQIKMDKPTNNPFCRGVLQKWEVLRLRGLITGKRFI